MSVKPAGWVALTATIGKTYHLAPLLAAAAPGVLARLLKMPTTAAAGAGLVAATAGWVAILGLGIEPTATLVSGQPGGVRLETALFLAVGVLIGAGYGPAALARRLAGRRSPRI